MSTIDFKRINRQLISYFRRRAPRQDSKDLTADTWMAIVRWYRGRCALRTFAFIVASKIVTRPKPQIRVAPLSDDDAPAADGPGPHSVLMLLANHDAIGRAVQEVDEVHRDVVQLWLAGRDYAQIAAILGIPYNTVRSRLRRGQAQAVIAVRAELGIE